MNPNFNIKFITKVVLEALANAKLKLKLRRRLRYCSFGDLFGS